MLLNDAFKKAAGLVKPAPVLTPQAAARKEKETPEDLSFDADVTHLRTRDQARVMARSLACKNASVDGQRLPFKERARYLQEIIEDGRRRVASNGSVLRAKAAP